MSYAEDNHHPLGASGSYGGIPTSEYLRKIETTNFYEDPNQLDSYYRQTLTDWKPDEPFLASDEARSSDDRGGGFGSAERLNLRHGGARTLEDPYLPDGTFLDHIGGMTDRDPRGHALGPDMREHVKQQYARKDLIKFYDDSDYSVPESGINPEQMRDNIKSIHYQFKDRYSNFDTSFDAWHNGGTGIHKRTGGSDVAKHTLDGTVLDLADSTQRNRLDATAILSNDPTIAFRHSTPDHRVKVTKYGMVRANQFLKENDWSNNRMSTFLDHNQMAVIDGTMVNKMLAHLIVDLEGMRQTRQKIAQGTEYGESYNTKTRKAKLSPQDVYKMMMIDLTAPQNANSEYDGKLLLKKTGVLNHDNRLLLDQSLFNHEIAASMVLATRKSRDKSEDNLRDLMEMVGASTDETTNSRETFSRKVHSGKKKTLNQNSLDTRYIENSRETMHYGGIKPSKTNRVNDMIAFNPFGSQSTQTLNRKGNRNELVSNDVTRNDYEQDQGLLDFGIYDKATKANSREHMGFDHRNMMDIGDGEYESLVGETDRMNFL